jgi:hypothetical protein
MPIKSHASPALIHHRFAAFFSVDILATILGYMDANYTQKI